jgi:hypothetical protein
MKNKARLNARQLMTGCAEGRSMADGPSAPATREMKYPGKPGAETKNLRKRIAAELQESPEIRSQRGVDGDAVRGEPVLIEPDVEEKHGHEPSEVEEILLDGDTSADRWSLDAQGGVGIREGEERVREEEVETCPKWKKDGDGANGRFLRDLEVLRGDEPEQDNEDRNNEQEQAHRVSIR